MADPTPTVYLVVLIEIHDRQRYDNEYVPAVLKLINKHGGRLVSAVDGAENLEGNLVKGRAVLIEFPSDEGNTGKTAGVDALFSCAGSGKSDSSYV